jgi:hypothetical protein
MTFRAVQDLLANVAGATHGRADHHDAAVAQLDAAADIPALAARLRAVLDGERDRDALITGLSVVDAQAVECVLAHGAHSP